MLIKLIDQRYRALSCPCNLCVSMLYRPNQTRVHHQYSPTDNSRLASRQDKSACSFVRDGLSSSLSYICPSYHHACLVGSYTLTSCSRLFTLALPKQVIYIIGSSVFFVHRSDYIHSQTTIRSTYAIGHSSLLNILLLILCASYCVVRSADKVREVLLSTPLEADVVNAKVRFESETYSNSTHSLAYTHRQFRCPRSETAVQRPGTRVAGTSGLRISPFLLCVVWCLDHRMRLATHPSWLPLTVDRTQWSSYSFR